MLRPFLLLTLCTAPLAAQTDPCTALATLHLDHATVSAATRVASATAPAGVTLPPARVATLPTFCRVQISATPTPDSDIRIDLWLPANAQAWNGRFLAHGNGGFAGEFNFSLMAASLPQGYATASTDTGHSSPTADFALGHPEKIKDFGWRGIHEMTTQSKAVIDRLLHQTHRPRLLCRLL